MRRGLEGGRHMERRRNRNGGRNRKGWGDGDRGGGGKELFSSRRGAGF